MLLRLAESADISEIYEVMIKCLPTYDPSFCMPNDRDFFIEMLRSKGLILVTEDKGNIIGYAVLDLDLGTETGNISKLGIPETEHNLTMNLEVCMVLEEYRGKGIQKEFINKALEIAEKREYKHIYSTAHPENVASLNNLLRVGFEKVMLSQNSKNEPRLLLYKAL